MKQKEIQKRLVDDMKKDKDLKQYSKDIKKLNQRQFNILLNVFKKVNKTTGGWTMSKNIKTNRSDCLYLEIDTATKNELLSYKIALLTAQINCTDQLDMIQLKLENLKSK